MPPTHQHHHCVSHCEHYGVTRFDAANVAVIVVDLTGTHCDDMATAQAIAARMRAGHGLAELLGFRYFPSRITR